MNPAFSTLLDPLERADTAVGGAMILNDSSFVVEQGSIHEHLHAQAGRN